MNNLAGEASFKEIKESFSEKLSSWIKETGDFLPGSVPVPTEKQKTRIKDPNNPEWKEKR